MDGKHFQYEHTDVDPVDRSILLWFIQETTMIGFNNDGYDNIMLLLMFNHASNQKMYDVSQRIIGENERSWSIMKTENLDDSHLDTIDIMPVLRGKAGLKLYGARIHFHRLQELPIDFDKETTRPEQLTLLDYCNNDTDVTEDLYHNIKGEVDLRIGMSEMYGIDLRSKSGAQIAELLLVKMCEEANHSKIEKPVIGADIPLEMKYKKPYWIDFKTDKYKQLLAEIEADTFYLNPVSGHLILGDSVKERIISLSDSNAKLGIGGLHAIISKSSRYSTEDTVICEADFASLYPNMIVNSQSYPAHFGEVFFDTYKEVLSSRLADKKAGRAVESDAKKLILNSTFGQLSNMYSKLYSPNLLLNTTLSGQLTLLMLIEQVELAGFDIFSGNTDSITLMIKRDRLSEFKNICSNFETQVNLTLEFDYYSCYVAQNVNSYFAKYEGSDKVKTKGDFVAGYDDSEHNPAGAIITNAVIKYYTEGSLIEDTINNSDDIRDFLFVRTIKGGGTYKGDPIGKVARFYYSTESDEALRYASNNNLVAKSNNSKPLLDLPKQFPMDVDKQRYIDEATALFKSVNPPAKQGRNKKAIALSTAGVALVPWPHKGVTVMKEGYDYSSCSEIGVQTGHRASTLAIKHYDNTTLMMGEWALYYFNDKRFPGAMATVSKKVGHEVMYGKAIQVTARFNGQMKQLPEHIEQFIFNSLNKAQKVKVLDGNDFLL
jgi:hypothetical protein